MTVIAQDDHITAWAASGWNQNILTQLLIYVLLILRSEIYSEATLSCTKPILKEATFPSTGLSCKTGRMAGNQPRRK